MSFPARKMQPFLLLLLSSNFCRKYWVPLENQSQTIWTDCRNIQKLALVNCSHTAWYWFNMMYVLLENCKQRLHWSMYFFAWIWIQKKIPFLPAVDPLKILVETGTGMFLTILTSKSFWRAGVVQIFATSTSKSAPRPSVFNDFDFQIVLARRRGANFADFNFQKCSRTVSF